MDVGTWLRRLGLEQYEQAFRDNAVDADVLPELTADDLREIGVAAVGHRRKLLAAIAELRLAASADAGGDAAPAPAPEPAPGEAGEEGERRQVTVLFADLCGYTRLSRELDAEEVHGLLDRFFGRVDRIVEEHGGRVDKHIGDSVMAVFGAPVAHGNDAERAVRAALAARAAMTGLSDGAGRALRVHIGVAGGQVVASGTGSAAYREYTVTGDTVNLASRLTEAAEADEILVSDAVRRDLGGHLVGTARGALEVRGIAEPVQAWRLEDLRAPEGARHRFVGRSGERHQFRAALAACRESGRGQTICLRGEAGIGKTSLVEEFQSGAREAGFACHTGVVLDFGAATGRDAVRGLLRDLLGLPADSGPAAARAAADDAREAGLIEPDAAVFLNDLLDLPQPRELRALYEAMDNATRYRGKCRTVARLVEGAARGRPRLLVVEDVHWADDLVLGYLAELAVAVAECPALLVLTMRMEGDPLDRGWRARTGGAPLLTLDLGPLRPDEARAIASDAFRGEPSLAERCIERAAGNPLFLQQLLLHAQETAELVVPGSVQSLVQGRLDRLDPSDKAALQAASVLGQQFAPGALAHLLGRDGYDPQPLVRNSLVRPEGAECRFAHALIRDAVYDTLLKRRRRELHARAAEWFDGRDPVLHAEHLERAGHAGAARAYLAAARFQAGQSRYEMARRLVDRGLAVAADDADRFALGCYKGDILHDLGTLPAARQAYEAALAAASDDRQRCQARIGLAAVKRITEDLDGAFDDLARAEEAALEHGLTAQRARIHFLRGNLCFPRGDVEGCLREHGRSLELARQAGQTELEAAALGGLGDAEYLRGRMRSAHDRLSACVSLCREHGFGRIEVANHAQIAHAMLFLAPQQEGLQEARRAAEAAARVGHHRAELNARNAAVTALAVGLDLPALKEELERARRLVEHLGARRFDQPRLFYLGRAALAQGQRDEAVRWLRQALEVARETGITFYGPTILGVLALALGRGEGSREALAEAEAIIAGGCVGANQLRFYPEAMQLMLDLGEHDEAERYAGLLEAFTSAEPLPWSGFFIARARALAAWGRGRRGAPLSAELDRLEGEGRRLGIAVALADIRAALADTAAR